MKARGANLLMAVGAVVTMRADSFAQSGSLVGVVRDTVGMPIKFAEVTVGPTSVRTDSIGRYYIVFSPRESVTVVVRRLGFELVSFTVASSWAAGNSIEVRMRPLAHVLPIVTVDETDLRNRTMMEGFDYRRSRGRGVFLTREDFARKGSHQLSNILRGERGLTLVRDRSGRNLLRFAKYRSKPNCAPLVWLDGRMVRNLEVDDIPVGDLEGVELYDGPSSTPGEFSRGTTTHCGTIVLWSSVPMLQKH